MANREKLGNSLQSLLGDAIGIGAEPTSKDITVIKQPEKSIT